MLKIRPEQLQAMQADADKPLVAWIAARLREQHAEAVQALDDARLAACVADDVARARNTYALDDAMAITAFVVTCFTRGARFDGHPRLGTLLRTSDVPAGARMDLVLRSATDGDWDEVRLTPEWFERRDRELA